MVGRRKIDHKAAVAEICSSGRAGRVCDDCAEKAGGKPPTDAVRMATYNFLVCDVCSQIKAVTWTRDWLWPWGRKPRNPVSRETQGVSRGT